MRTCEQIYESVLRMPSDIVEHMPTLRDYARDRRILELGVRRGCSTVALLAGRPKLLISVDKWRFEFDRDLPQAAENEGIPWTMVLADSWEPQGEVDLVFFDTYHTAERVQGEITTHEPNARELLIFHDTVSNGLRGEGGAPGILGPIQELLARGNWAVERVFTNNNGLMILRRTT